MKKVFCFAALVFSLLICFVQQFFLKYRKLQLCDANARIGIFRQ